MAIFGDRLNNNRISGARIVERYRVVVKRIVSADGKIVSEAKSIAKVSDVNKSYTKQSVSVNTAFDRNSSSRVKSSSSSSSSSSSTS